MTSTHTLLIDLDLCDSTIEVEVTYEHEVALEGVTHLAPEDCYPAEEGYLAATKLTHTLKRKTDPIVDLSDLLLVPSIMDYILELIENEVSNNE